MSQNLQTINKLRFAHQQQLSGGQLLQANLFKEYIDVYGIEAIYFKSDAFDRKWKFVENGGRLEPKLRNDKELLKPDSERIYRDPIELTYVSAAMIPLHFEMNADAFILNTYGINPNQEATVTFTINEFNLAFPTPRTEKICKIDKKFIIKNYKNNKKIHIDDKTKKIVFRFNFNLSGFEVSGSLDNDAIEIETFFITEDNRYFKPNENYKVAGFYTAEYDKLNVYKDSTVLSANLIEIEDTNLSGHIFGEIHYNCLSDFKNFLARVTPIVGDYIRLPFFDDNEEEWEITNVVDRNIMDDGINPLLTKYVWQCDVVRRTYSEESIHTDLSGKILKDSLDNEFNLSSIVEKPHENAMNREIIDDKLQKQEDISNNIFDYNDNYINNINKRNLDRIYGRFDSKRE